jgi:hypothetical protein
MTRANARAAAIAGWNHRPTEDRLRAENERLRDVVLAWQETGRETLRKLDALDQQVMELMRQMKYQQGAALEGSHEWLCKSSEMLRRFGQSKKLESAITAKLDADAAERDALRAALVQARNMLTKYPPISRAIDGSRRWCMECGSEIWPFSPMECLDDCEYQQTLAACNAALEVKA